jgi:hypothetical protein
VGEPPHSGAAHVRGTTTRVTTNSRTHVATLHARHRRVTTISAIFEGRYGMVDTNSSTMALLYYQCQNAVWVIPVDLLHNGVTEASCITGAQTCNFNGG